MLVKGFYNAGKTKNVKVCRYLCIEAKKEAPRRKAREAPFYKIMALTFPAAFRVVVNGNIATGRCWCKCPGFVRVFYLVPFLGFLVPFYGLFLRPGVFHSVPLLFPVYGVFKGG